jgi:hypothetical protein
MRLASEDVLAIAANVLAAQLDGISGYRTDMLDHPIAGWCLRNFVILTEFPELLGESKLSEPELYWSRYYWLARFACVWFAVAGNDAGLEQQVSTFVEYPPDGWECYTVGASAGRRGRSFVEYPPDGWECYPDVTAAVERDAAEQLRAAGIA